MPTDYLLHEWINSSANPANLVSIPPGCHSRSLLVTLNTCRFPSERTAFPSLQVLYMLLPHLKWNLLPLPSTGPLHLSLDIQGCNGQICKLFTRQEWPAQGATGNTNICLGLAGQAVHSSMGLHLPWGVGGEGGVHLFQFFMKFP